MQWSKTRKLLDDRLADSLSGRLRVHLTRYGWARDEDGRAWVTFDGREMANFCCWTFLSSHYPLARDIREACGTGPDRTAPDADRAGSEAREILHRRGIFSEEEFLGALLDYLQLSVDNALRSEDPLVRALAMLDRRLGKRRLRVLSLESRVEHPLVRQFLGIRLRAEGMENDAVPSLGTSPTEATAS